MLEISSDLRPCISIFSFENKKDLEESSCPFWPHPERVSPTELRFWFGYRSPNKAHILQHCASFLYLGLSAWMYIVWYEYSLINIVNRTPSVGMDEFAATRTHISAIVLLRNNSKQHDEILYTHKSSMFLFYG